MDEPSRIRAAGPSQGLRPCPARSASSARARNPGARLSGPARPRPQPPTSDPASPAPRHVRDPANLPGGTRPGRRCLPTSRPPGPRRTQPRELLSPDGAAGPSRDLRRCLHPQPAQLQLRRRQPRTPMGRRSRARAAAEASGTAATSTGGVSRQGVGASGHATLAPPKNRVGPTPRRSEAEPKKTRPGGGAGPRSGAGPWLLNKTWTEGRGLSCGT